MKVKLFSHTDLDGIGCNIVAKATLENLGKHVDVDCENLNYDTVDKTVKEFIINENYKDYDLIYITDISVSEEVAESINNLGEDKFKLLDHHPTALHLNKYNWATVDIERNNEKTCGTAMLYSQLGLEDDYLNDWVECIRKYDTWLWKEKYNDLQPKELNDLFFILGKEEFIKEALKSIKDEIRIDKFIEKYRKILNKKQEEIDKYIDSKNKSIIKIDKNNIKIGVVFAEQYHSELGNKLSELNPDCHFIMIINGNKVSLRTVKDDINCGKIAETFGGGGHPKAAGFIIKDEIVISFIKNVLTK